MYFWYFHSMKHLNCHSASFLIGVRRTLPARSQREKGDQHVFSCQLARLNQNTTWSKTISPLTFKVHSDLVGLIGCVWKHRWVKYPTSQAVSGKASLYALMYPPSSSLTIPRGSRISQQMRHLLGEGRIQAHKDHFFSSQSPSDCLVISPKTAWTQPSKLHSQISFLSPNTIINLYTKQSPPAYYRLP